MMTLPEKSEVTLYASDYIAKLIIGSFKFSQRDGRIAQDQILCYLAHRFDVRLAVAAIDASFGQARAAAWQIITDPKLHKPGYKGAGPEVYMAIEGLKLRQREHREPDMPLLTRRIIALDMVNMGHRYRADPDPSDPARDPYMSFFAYHGLMRRDTGLVEYDQMFGEIVATYESHVCQENAAHGMVARIVGSYILHHPEYLSEIPASYHPTPA